MSVDLAQGIAEAYWWQRRFDDCDVLAIVRRVAFSSALHSIVVATSILVATSSGSLGACKTILRGELVQAPNRQPGVPKKFLFFFLVEITRTGERKAEKLFQSFVIPSARDALPISFALNVDSRKDCPSEVELRVDTDDKDHPLPLHFGDQPLISSSSNIRLDEFQRILVWGPTY